jgi:release factor glutamine methyltransferase
MSRAPASTMAAGQVFFSSEQAVGVALSEMARLFASAGLDGAQRDARFLLQGVLGLDGAELLARPDKPLDAAAGPLNDAVRRRLAHEPVSRILGRRGFYGREFIVTPDVLDPRSDTEAVVDLALDLVRAKGLAASPLRLADIGTGSGILLVTLLAELPKATGLATDLSPAALAVARTNAERLGVEGRATFIATSCLAGCEGPFDLVVTNPPYIATAEIRDLEPEVRNYDPALALDGGPDGLQIYRDIATDIAKLQHSLLLVAEVGAGQAEAVEAIFQAAGGRLLGRREDLGSHVRAVALEIHC